MLNVVLYRPEIPPNTGNIGRLTLGTGTRLHIVGKPSFQLDADTAMKRAGLDYWENVQLKTHSDWQQYLEETEGPRLLVTKFGDTCYRNHNYIDGTHLIFGGETRGVPDSIHEDSGVERLFIPMNENIRSYNLANSVAIVLFEALGQIRAAGFNTSPFSEN